ncbi:hypothetical protein [Actinoplanes sp. NPDC051851]|uniref:MmyB family transcriptional regulator n=1 Tax=Actinoplanes sp. NPDC051851 TaxID=3154753 RepID=UPI003436D089
MRDIVDPLAGRGDHLADEPAVQRPLRGRIRHRSPHPTDQPEALYPTASASRRATAAGGRARSAAARFASRIRQTADERAEFERSLVADLRASTGRYPNDPELGALVTRLLGVPRFRELWDLRAVAEHETARKTVEHPQVGDIAIDAYVLTTQGTDLRMVVSTPRPGTDARGRLDLAATIGVQEMRVSSPGR